jgi:hypothetical protein
MSRKFANAPRSWWRNEFHDHPGRPQKLDDAYIIGGTTKVEKTYCKPCFATDVNEIIERNEVYRQLGRQVDLQSKEEVGAYRTLQLVLSVCSINPLAYNHLKSSVDHTTGLPEIAGH